MMKKRAASLFLSAALCLSLAACGGGSTGGVTKFDAKVYVEGLLSEHYLGTASQEYLDLVQATAEDVQYTYEIGLNMETQKFYTRFGIENPTQDYQTALHELYDEIYSHAKFDVTSAARQEDGSFSVKVSVEPINIIDLMEEQWEETMKPFYDDYPSDIQNAMTNAEYAEIAQEYADMVLELAKSCLEKMGNLPAEEIVVQLEQDKDGVYEIAAGDFSRINQRIIDYPAGTD